MRERRGERAELVPDDGDVEAPPDVGLLADAVRALEARRLPGDAALEEIVHLARGRALVARELRRLSVLEVHAELAASNPGAGKVLLAQLTARRTGVPVETVRWWARLDSTSEDLDDPGGRR